MSAGEQGEVSISSESDIVAARKVVREAAMKMAFGITDVTRIVTAASELARNVFQYAETGTMHWRIVENEEYWGIELSFEDQGPGIADIEEALQAGFSTSGGLGFGLPGAKRLMDEMEIESSAGAGTRVTVRKWHPR
ncbi:MAG TPA: anti-sigma regulatory factor [Anaerolineales bacterium]|jgi:serine/threonine-protein kinase RsbT|nr:anti-sigma regulatory factor [Anaerolineales bacterium]